MIRTRAPTVVLQGMQDPDVPYAHALALMERLGGDPATLTLIKDGDHRLSRPQDLELLFDALKRLIDRPSLSRRGAARSAMRQSEPDPYPCAVRDGRGRPHSHVAP